MTVPIKFETKIELHFEADLGKAGVFSAFDTDARELVIAPVHQN